MENVFLTKEYAFFPKQPWLIDKRIDTFGKIPTGASRVKISSVKHNGQSAAIFFNFIAPKAITAFEWIRLNGNQEFDVMLKNETPSFYIFLDWMACDATEVSFDLEFK